METKIIEKAKLCEQAERYEDMAKVSFTLSLFSTLGYIVKFRGNTVGVG